MRTYSIGAARNPHCYDAFGLGAARNPHCYDASGLGSAHSMRRYGAYGVGQAEKKKGPLDGFMDSLGNIIGGAIGQIETLINDPKFFESPLGQQLIQEVMGQQGVSREEAIAALRQQFSGQPQKQTPAWVLPVAIGGGVLVLSLVILLVARR